MIRFAAFLLATAIGFAAATYSYDSAGRRLAKVDYGTGGFITYTYDKAGNLLSRTISSGTTSPSTAEKKKPAAKKEKPRPAPAR